MKVLLATDGTKHSDAAVEMVLNLSLENNSELSIISVIDMAIPMAVDIYTGFLPDTTEIEKAARENAKKTLEETSDLLNKKLNNKIIEIETEILFGSPESRIVEKAEEMNADLIVVGSHGYNRWERLLLGSVSDSVVHHAPCSVLVVRSKEEE